ncbi:MAG: pilus assembly protein PilP [Pseudomonadota bacterium]
MKRAILLLAFALAGCSAEEFSDLKQFVEQSGQGLRGKVPPLPKVKSYEAFAYNAFDLPDPFTLREIDTRGKPGPGGPGPDLNRPREPLEAYPLENLKMVGTLERGKRVHALIKTPDNNVFRVTVGNYLGQNFGRITRITEAEVTLTELVQEGAGGWTERTASLQLVE